MPRQEVEIPGHGPLGQRQRLKPPILRPRADSDQSFLIKAILKLYGRVPIKRILVACGIGRLVEGNDLGDVRLGEDQDVRQWASFSFSASIT